MCVIGGVIVFVLLVTASNSSPINVSEVVELPWTADELVQLLSEALLQDQNEQHLTKGPITAKSVFIVPDRVGHCPPGTRVDPAGKCRPEFKPDPANHLGFLLARLAHMYRNGPERKIQKQKSGPLLLNIPFPTYTPRENSPETFDPIDNNRPEENHNPNNKIVDNLGFMPISTVNREHINMNNVNNTKSTTARVNRTSVTATNVLSSSSNTTLNNNNETVATILNSTTERVQNASDISAETDTDINKTGIISASTNISESFSHDTNISSADPVVSQNNDKKPTDAVIINTGSISDRIVDTQMPLHNTTTLNNFTMDLDSTSEESVNDSTIIDRSDTDISLTVLDSSETDPDVEVLNYDTQDLDDGLTVSQKKSHVFHEGASSVDNNKTDTNLSHNSTSNISTHDLGNRTFESPEVRHNNTYSPITLSNDTLEDSIDKDISGVSDVANNGSDSVINGSSDYSVVGATIRPNSAVDSVSAPVVATISDDTSESVDRIDLFGGPTLSNEDSESFATEANKDLPRNLESGFVPYPHQISVQNPTPNWWTGPHQNIPYLQNPPLLRHQPPEWIKWTEEVLESIKELNRESAARRG